MEQEMQVFSGREPFSQRLAKAAGGAGNEYCFFAHGAILSNGSQWCREQSGRRSQSAHSQVSSLHAGQLVLAATRGQPLEQVRTHRFMDMSYGPDCCI